MRVLVLVLAYLSTCVVVYRLGWNSGWLESSRECRESMDRVTAEMNRVTAEIKSISEARQ